MTSDQLTEADVQRMYAAKQYAAIEEARTAGRLATVLGQPLPIADDHVVTRAEVQQMLRDRRHQEVEALRQAGRLEHLTNPAPTQKDD